MDHNKICSKEVNQNRTNFFGLPVHISIKQTRINMDKAENRQYTEYMVQIVFGGKQWHVCRRYKAFC
jgi:hypothetical protein